jgi:hypothetical protein
MPANPSPHNHRSSDRISTFALCSTTKCHILLVCWYSSSVTHTHQAYATCAPVCQHVLWTPSVPAAATASAPAATSAAATTSTAAKTTSAAAASAPVDTDAAFAVLVADISEKMRATHDECFEFMEDEAVVHDDDVEMVTLLVSIMVRLQDSSTEAMRPLVELLRSFIE